MNNYLFFPLSWVSEAFAVLRQEAINGSSALTALCMGLACTFVALSFLQTAYVVMSDERHSGFGGIELWEVVRPILIILAIAACSTILGAYDGLVRRVTNAVENSISQLDTKTAIYTAIKKYEYSNFAEEQQSVMNDFENEIAKNHAEYTMIGRAINGLSDKATAEKYAARLAEKLADDPKERPAVSELRDALLVYYSRTDKLKSAKDNQKLTWSTFIPSLTNGTLIPAIANWLYDIFAQVIQVAAEIFMCILALLAPLMLCLSLLPPFKGNIITFLTTYLQLSTWPILASCVRWCVDNVRCAVLSNQADVALQQIKQIANSEAIAESSSALGGLMISAIVAIAGFFAIMQVPAMAQTIIPSNSSIGSSLSTMGSALLGGLISTTVDTANKGKQAAGGLIGKLSSPNNPPGGGGGNGGGNNPPGGGGGNGGGNNPPGGGAGNRVGNLG